MRQSMIKRAGLITRVLGAVRAALVAARRARLRAGAMLMSMTGLAMGQPVPSGVLGDGMVLQRGVPARLWGKAEAGATVRAELVRGGAVVGEASGGADAEGAWRLELPAQPAGGPYEIRLFTDAGERVLRDVLFGDVWVASGQSNMRWSVSDSADARAEIAASDYPRIRLLTVLEDAWDQPRAEARTVEPWRVCGPATSGGFSAVAYHFGRELHEHFAAQGSDVPIGLVLTAWGGTPAEAWTPMESLKAMPECGPIIERWADAPTMAERAAIDQRRDAMMRRAAVEMFESERGWQEASTSDEAWATASLPGHWPSNSFDGVVWYRRTVTLDAAGASAMSGGATLTLGAIDDADVVYINGQEVGRTGLDVPGHWSLKRAYDVKPGVLREGANLIAVRVLDAQGGGGISAAAGEMALTAANGSGGGSGGGSALGGLDLAGEWKWRTAWDARNATNGLPQLAELDRFRPQDQPATLYNAMIAPLTPMAVRGFIWYQGESNAGRAEQYATLFPGMISAWRERFGQGELPFLFVQLANWRERHATPVESDWAELREAQAKTLALPATGMATAIDIGDAGDIHPRNKRDVGRRLALAARAVAYGQTLVHHGPRLLSTTIEPGSPKALVRLSSAEGLRTSDGGPVRGFAIAGEDRVWHWADARIYSGAEGPVVAVTSPKVLAPVAVRYAWADNPEANLVNAEGLPAEPFRTDDWPGVTTGRR